jgi:hypothetical protein
MVAFHLAKLVYISCPMTLGNRNWNWFQAAEAQVSLMRAGFAVHNPVVLYRC